jgi:hypothetical protein
LIRISLRSPAATATATEWVSVCILIGLALVSLVAAFEHIGRSTQPLATPARTNARLTPIKAPQVLTAPVVYQTNPIRAAGRLITEPATKTLELPKLTRIVPPVRDMNDGEADRAVPAGTAIVIGRQKDLPLLRDDEAFETWGGEFAKGDSRLREMIQAGALTSVQKGARVKILEVRGALAHVEVIGQARTGWIRSSFVGR